MAPEVRGVRKRLMIYLWRAQQSGAIINILLLGTLTAASLYRLYLKDYFDNFGFPPEQELPGVLITMFLIFLAVFGIGFAFDRLKFWKEQSIVGIERNPYGSYKLTAKEIHWIRLWSAAVTAGKPTAEQQEVVAHFEQWVKRSLEEDGVLRAEVDAVDRWIEKGDQSIKNVFEGAD
jgi:hypothetical protein